MDIKEHCQTQDLVRCCAERADEIKQLRFDRRALDEECQQRRAENERLTGVVEQQAWLWEANKELTRKLDEALAALKAMYDRYSAIEDGWEVEPECHLMAQRILGDYEKARRTMSEILDWLRDPRYKGHEGMRAKAVDEIERLKRDVSHWREARETAMEAGEILKARAEAAERELEIQRDSQISAVNAMLLAERERDEAVDLLRKCWEDRGRCWSNRLVRDAECKRIREILRTDEQSGDKNG